MGPVVTGASGTVLSSHDNSSIDNDKSSTSTATTTAAATAGKGEASGKKPSLIDELDDAIQSCFSGLIGPDYRLDQNIIDIRANVEPSLQQLLEVCRQLEAHFIKRRYQMVAVKPSWLLSEEMNDMKLELKRRDELLVSHKGKVVQWKQMLSQHPQQAQQAPPPMMQPPVGGPGGGHAGMMHMLQQQQHAPGHVLQYHQMVPGPVAAGRVVPSALLTRLHGPPPPTDGSSPMGTPVTPVYGAPVTGPPVSSNVAQSLMFTSHPPQHAMADTPGPLARLEQTTSNIGMPVAPPTAPPPHMMHSRMH